MRALLRMCSVSRIWAPVMALAFMLVGCGDDDTVNPPGAIDNSLVFTREDSSEVEFPAGADAYVWCGPWEDDVPVFSLHVWFGSPGEPVGWQLQAVVGDIEIGDTLRFPNSFIWNQPDGVFLFLLDPPNELATSMEESGGFIVFHRLPCRSGSTVDFSIDAVMGSELGDMPPVSVRGRFTAQITGTPSARVHDSRLGVTQKKHSIVRRRSGGERDENIGMLANWGSFWY